MFGNAFYAFTAMAYIGLAAVNLYKPNATGERLMGWGFIIFAILAAYVLCSLLLTLNLAINGKLDWISASKASRNVIIGLGFLCLMNGIVFVTMVNADANGASTANWLGLLVIRYGAIWIPLLMLAPFAILLKPEWLHAFSPNLYKIPLMVACFIGFAFFALGREQLGGLFTDKQAVAEKKYQESMRLIDLSDDTGDLLYYLLYEYDIRVREAALTKLKAKPDLESELLDVLGHYQENGDYRWVIIYLEDNTVEHPERFVEPLNRIINRISEELKYRLQSFGNENDFLETLNVDGLCHVLDTQFKAYNADFRPNMMNVYSELEREPKPEFLAIRNKYKAVVKNWLDSN